MCERYQLKKLDRKVPSRLAPSNTGVKATGLGSLAIEIPFSCLKPHAISLYDEHGNNLLGLCCGTGPPLYCASRQVLGL